MNLAKMTPQQVRLRLLNRREPIGPESCLAIARRSFEVRYGDAAEMLAWARLAVDFLPADCPREIRGECLAHLGNALRVGGLLEESRSSLLVASELAPSDPLVHEFSASLFESVRDFPAALRHLEEAAVIHRDLGQREGQAKVLLQVGMVLDLLGKSAEAAVVVDSVLDLIDDEDLARAAAQTLVHYLVNSGQYVRALRVFALSESLFARGKQLFRLKVDWLRSKTYAGLGDDGAAMVAWQDVRVEYRRRGMAQEVALISLEMGIQHARRGRFSLAAAEAGAVLPLLIDLGIARDAGVAAQLRLVAGRKVRVAQMAERLSSALIAIQSRAA